ncbi:hypothetical protein HYW75_04770 [Candidatus Pacearchaeota archaeon]|nr:hypothetical protein [Candidatus Pacearchaeota archaeon]
MENKQVLHFPFQVKRTEELRVGERYIPVHKPQVGKINIRTEIKVLEIYSERNWIKVEEKSKYGNPIISDQSLADFGVVPYKEKGLWNSANCLVPASHKSDLLRIIEEIRTKYK